jgi:hypothetical protein
MESCNAEQQHENRRIDKTHVRCRLRFAHQILNSPQIQDGQQRGAHDAGTGNGNLDICTDRREDRPHGQDRRNQYGENQLIQENAAQVNAQVRDETRSSEDTDGLENQAVMKTGSDEVDREAEAEDSIFFHAEPPREHDVEHRVRTRGECLVGDAGRHLRRPTVKG